MVEEKKSPESILRDVFETERQDDPDARIQELGKEFVNRLFMLYRTGRVHDLGNDAVANALRALKNVIDQVSMYMKDIQLLSVGDAFYLNKVLLKVDFSTFENFRYLADVMKEQKISGFQFTDPEDDDLRALLVAWRASSGDPDEKNWLGHFSNSQIQVAPAKDIEESKTRMISAETLSDPTYLLRLYMKSFFGIRYFMQCLESGEFISLSGMQRSIHEFIDAMGNDTRNILGLASIRMQENRLACNAVNVALLSILLGKEIGLKRNKLSDLGMAAFLHDIGRIQIAPEILDKAERLTEEEKRQISQSNHLSLMQLVKLRGFNESALRRMLVAFEHTLDASQESGFKRPTVLARIVAITHCFVAMTTKQPYRDPMLPHEALKIMASSGQTKFDPSLLRSFARLITPYPPGSLVLTGDRELAIVADAFAHRPHALAPEVQPIYDPSGRKRDPKTPPIQLKGTEDSKVLKSLDANKFGINPLRVLFPRIAHEVDTSKGKGGT